MMLTNFCSPGSLHLMHLTSISCFRGCRRYDRPKHHRPGVGEGVGVQGRWAVQSECLPA